MPNSRIQPDPQPIHLSRPKSCSNEWSHFFLLSTLDAPGQLQVEEALLGILDRSPEVYNWDEFITTRLLGLASEEYEVLKSWILSQSGLPHVQDEDRLTRAYETAELLARETAKVRGLLRPT
jgi:hypothetical protein